jgi:regulator of nucleoside diphosphate kinase
LRLAEALSRRNPDLAEQLFAELERADVVSDDGSDRCVVRMGSTLRYESNSGDERVVTLVYPGDEDIAQGRISILTPIGIALIGLAEGDSIDWRTQDGRLLCLTVASIASSRRSSGEALDREAVAQ